jgi:hypothetical protein
MQEARREQEKEARQVAFLLLRYVFLFFAAAGNFFVLRKIFFPLTAYATFFLPEKFLLVDACVAVPAYYLLLFLCFSCFDVKLWRRISAFIFSSAVFFVFNISRIALLSVVAETAFAALHFVLWHIAIFVAAGIWLLAARIFTMPIPLYSDMAFLFSLLRKKRKKASKTKVSNSASLPGF